MKIKHFLRVLLILLVFSISIPTFAQSNNQTTEQDKKEQVVYVTETGTRYHGVNCGYLHSSKIETTLTSATNHGYTACSRCKGSPSYYPKSKSSSSSSSTTVQCSGTTQAGNRCKRKTKSANGRCYQH